ncbi:MAG: filamentous hemagglutinin N-terminal domain-containing protein, partial [Candidatus Omnitrophica bacterium]|nr:filamentous hemagglutinin N-terminal domain-containing protein [Candidatus Omnitrophota bacterium]
MVKKMKLNMLRKIGSLTLVLAFFFNQTAFALPQVDEVVEGNVTIETPDANTMNINVADPQAIINYSSFDINANETVNVNLPSSTSEILNRDIGSDMSNILGTLNCNGLFILVNTHGIYV